MASVVKVKVGKNIYLYESTSFRNEQGKPRNKRVMIGKVDRTTGLNVYKEEYIKRMAEKGVVIKSAEVTPMYSVEDIKSSSVLQTGLVHLLNGITKTTGLLPVLDEAIPFLSDKIVSVAMYLVASQGEPVSYCDEWMKKSGFNGDQILSSQRISELFQQITDSDIEQFYTAWSDYRTEREYLALDITSVSSWSKLIDDVEWGYNRDGDKLAQINLSMLFGLQSRLPVRMTIYNGSIRDVSTLKTTLDQIAPEKLNQLMVVMDKGFSSKKNINLLLENKDIRFLLALPFTFNFTKQIVLSQKDRIDTLQNTITSSGNIIRGIRLERTWIKGKKIFVYVYFNSIKAASVKNSLYGYVSKLAENARINPNNGKLQKLFERYLRIRKSSKQECGYTVSIKEEVVNQEITNAGWLVIVSNDLMTPGEAIRIYRDKDVVEKGFHRVKNALGLNRLRVHSQQTTNAKVFVGFIALILTSHIHRVMLENDLYKSMTMKELMNNMKKLRTQVINGKRILFPLTKKQKKIYELFKVKHPV